MFSTVGVFVIWSSVVKANKIIRPPDATKRTSAATYVKKILSRAIVIVGNAIEDLEMDSN